MAHRIGRDEATLMLALLVGGADGKADPQEEAALHARLRPILGRLGPEGEARAVRTLADLLRTVGLEHTLTSLRATYRMHEERLEAFRLAAHLAFADGVLAPAEVERVAHIAAVFQLSEGELRACLPQRA